MGTKALSKVQFGGETTAGTAVAADIIWRGPFAGIKDARVTELVGEDIGIALPSNRSYASQLMATLALPATPFTPEQAPHIFEAGIKAVGTGIADGDSSGKKYTYPFGISSLNTVKTYTFETGDETQAEEMEYSVVQSFTITAVRGQAVMLSSNWFGRQATNATFTGALSPVAVSHLHASTGSLYIDPNTNPFGTTAVASGNLFEMSLTINTGQTALFTIDSGALYFVESYFNKDAFSAEMTLKFSHAAASLAERTAWRANTPRLIRLEFTGDAYGTPGTTGDFTTKALVIDFPGSWREFTEVAHEDGRSFISGTLVGGYDSTSGEGLEIAVYNEDATLT